jgi:hypothetical protein
MSAAEAAWDRCLRERTDSAEIAAWFEAWQGPRGLLLAGRAVARIARPLLVTPERLAADRRVASGLIGALTRATRRVEQDDALARRLLGRAHGHWAEQRAIDPGYPQRCVIGRIDVLPTAEGSAAVEYNTSPGGVVSTDLLADLYLELAERIGFLRDWELVKIPVVPRAEAALREAYRAWGGTGQPFVAFVMPREFGKFAVQVNLLARGLEARGLQSEIVDPEELVFDGTALRCRERKVDLLVRVFFGHVPSIEARMQGVLAALRAGSVCMVTAFRNTLLAHKALFALLTDPAVGLDLEEDEARVVRAHVPWTRLLVEGRTAGPEGAEVDLLPWARENRERLVLKPAGGMGGAGVSLGWAMSGEDWAARIADGVAAGDYLLQARVASAASSWPMMAAGFPATDLYTDQNLFLADGQLAGYFVRLSPTPITNMALGASMLPALQVRPRDGGSR